MCTMTPSTQYTFIGPFWGEKGGRRKNVKNFRLKGHPPSPVFMMATPSEQPVQQRNKESFGWGGGGGGRVKQGAHTSEG